MKISIIIPVGHKDENFSLIKQIREKFKECEIILAASYQNAKAKDQSDEVDQLLSIHNSTRSKALNLGAEIAKNDLLWFLHLDSDLSMINEIDINVAKLEKINTFNLKFSNKNLKYNSLGANLRTKYLGIPFGNQSFIIDKRLFNFIGEFSENLEVGEAHDFIWKSKKIGIKINLINKHVINLSNKYDINPFFQTILSIKETILQIIKFRKPRVTHVVCHFLKDPLSKKSKKNLRQTTSDEFVNDINENLVEILERNIKEIKSISSIHQIIIAEKIHKKFAFKFSKIANGLFFTSHDNLGKAMKEILEYNINYFEKVVLVSSNIPLLKAVDIIDSTKIRSAKNIFYPTIDGSFCLLATSDNDIIKIIDSIDFTSNSALNDLTKKTTKLLIYNKFYRDIYDKEDLLKIFNYLKENNSKLNPVIKRLYTLLYSNQKKFLE